MRNEHKILDGKPERRHFGDLVADGIILKWILQKQDIKVWTGFIWLRIGTCGGLLQTW
jgi:hypothetical protein